MGIYLPAGTDEFVRSEAMAGLESFGEVVSGDEVEEMSAVNQQTGFRYR